MVKTTLPDSDNRQGVYDSDEEIADLERRFHEPSATTSGSDIARQKEVDALNDAYAMPSAEEPTAVQQEKSAMDRNADNTDNQVGKGMDIDKALANKKQPKTRLGKIVGTMSNGKKAKIAGIVIGVIMSGGVIGGLAGGPIIAMFHLQNWSEMLQSVSTQQNEYQNTTKITKLYRYWKNDDLGRTRLGVIQAKAQPILLKNMAEKSGYSITYDKLVGQIKYLHLDPSKIPELQGKSVAEIKTTLSEKYGIPLKNIQGTSNRIHLLFKDSKISVQRALLRDMVKANGSGKFVSFLQMHLLKKYYNVPDLLHPFKKFEAYTDRKFRNAVERSKFFEKLKQQREGAIAERIKLARAKLDDFRLANKGKLAVASVASAAVGIICMVHDGAQSVDAIQRSYYIEPGMLAAASGMAQGDQTKQDIDVTSEAIEEASEAQYDKAGNSVFDGNAAMAIQNLPQRNIDDTGTYASSYSTMKDVFSGNTGASQIVASLNSVGINGQTLCHPAVQFADLILGIGLTITGGGKVVSVAAKFAISSVLLGATINFITELIAGTPPDLTPNSGPVGGDLSIFGAAETGNLTSRSAAGSELSTQQAAILGQQIAAETRTELTQKGTIASIFDASDYRTVAGRLVNGISPSASTNLSNAVASLTNIGSTVVSRSLSLFNPKAHAATNDLYTTRLGMKTYGQQPEVLNIEDPYENANKAADLLDAGADSYIIRAKVCYGSEIAKATNPDDGGQYWDVNSTTPTDPSTPDYANAHCNDMSDKNWVVISGFVSYAQLAETLACGEAHIEESCQRIGVSSTLTSSATSSADAVGPATLQRAQGSWGGYTNGKIGIGTDGYKTVLTPISSVSLSGCSGSISVPYLHPKAAAALKALNDAYTEHFGYGLILESCYRTYDQQVWAYNCYTTGSCNNGNKAADPGTSNHGWGLAVDVAMTRYGGYDSPNYKWLKQYGKDFGFVAGVVSGEPWHIEYARPVQ